MVLKSRLRVRVAGGAREAFEAAFLCQYQWQCLSGGSANVELSTWHGSRPPPRLEDFA
jgi:hypothetical protein